MVKIVRVNLGCKADDGETSLQQGFRDLGSQTTSSSSDECNSCSHAIRLRDWSAKRKILNARFRGSASPSRTAEVADPTRALLVRGRLQRFHQPWNDHFFEDPGVGPDANLPAQVASVRVDPRIFRDIAFA